MERVNPFLTENFIHSTQDITSITTYVVIRSSFIILKKSDTDSKKIVMNKWQ